jgi:hypothetical protein
MPGAQPGREGMQRALQRAGGRVRGPHGLSGRYPAIGDDQHTILAGGVRAAMTSVSCAHSGADNQPSGADA